MLAFLLLTGLLWAWSHAWSVAGPAMGSEPGSFSMLEADQERVQPGMDAYDAHPVCLKPASVETPPVERVLSEVADLQVLHCAPVWLLPTQGAPVQGAQLTLQEAGVRPLLRPPAALG